MKAPKGNANRQIVVLLASATAGGLYGLWRALPGDWSGIVRVSTAYAVLGLIAGYWAYVWLRPRKTRGTLIGAAIGTVTLITVCTLLPEQYVSNRIFAIIDAAFVGAFVGALFSTAPRGATIGAGTGALFGFALFFVIVLFVEGGDYSSIPWSIIICGTFFWMIVGAWIGVSRELDRRRKLTKPHP
jgi:hypothetical protein